MPKFANSALTHLLAGRSCALLLNTRFYSFAFHSSSRTLLHLKSRGLAVRNSFRGLPCVYCGAPATSDDHVIAAKFFLEPQRGNLPQVPACERCNNEKSHLEDYL